MPKLGSQKIIHQSGRRLPPRNQIDAKYIQAVAETLLYYGQAVDSTILPALSAIATKQAKPTAKTMAMVTQLLDYCALQEEAIMTFKARNMIVQVHSNAGYASKKKSRSQAGGHFYLLYKDESPKYNGAILTTSTIIKFVMSSAAEAKLGALFINAKEAVHIRNILTKMGHPQPHTPIQMNKTTAEGVIYNCVQPK